MRGSKPPKYEVREVLKTLEKAGLESKLPIYDDGRMIVEESHLALKDEMKFSARKYLAPNGLQEVELQQEGQKLDAAGVLHVPLTEYKAADPTTPSPLSVETPADKRSLPVENRFTEALERDQAVSGERERAWTKPSAKLEKKWKCGIHPTEGQRTGISVRLQSYCKI